MIINEKQIGCSNCKGIKIFIEKKGEEIARAYLYLIQNDLRSERYGLMEDVFVDEKLRGRGIGTKLIKKIIKLAKECNCYKLICTSRYEKEKVHTLYEHIGFKDHGKEFRIDL
jgi:GNAT superfamily N-acetyltransferase